MNQFVEKNLYNINKILNAYLGVGKDMSSEQMLALSESLRIMATSEPSGQMSMAADKALGRGRFGISGLK